MITNVKKSHCLAVTNLKKIHQITVDIFIFTSKNKLKEHEEICNNHDIYRIEMAKWSEKKLKYNQAKKPLKEPFATYLDLECLLRKEQSHSNNNNNNNNIEESHTEKKGQT